MGGGGVGIRVLRQTYGKDQLGNSNKNTIQNRSFTTQHQAVNSATLRDIPNIFLPLELHEVELKIKSSIKKDFTSILSLNITSCISCSLPLN